MSIKRVVAANGQVLYFKDGKRVSAKSGAKLFVKENAQQIRGGSLPLDVLTKQERTSYQAQNRASKYWRYKGRILPNPFGILDASFSGRTQGGSKELSNIIDMERLERFYNVALIGSEQTFIKRNEDGDLSYYKSNITGHIADVINLVQGKTYRGYTLTVIDEQGNELDKNEGLEAMREFEARNVEQLTDRDAGIAFDYYIRINASTMQIIVYLNRTKVLVISA
jgi:hypothetical protein